MIEILLQPQAYLFTISLAIVLGLFILEIISLILGGSIMAIGSDTADIDVDLDIDFDLDIDLDAGADVGIAVPPTGFLRWIGIADVPFLIWLVSFLTLFGLIGLILLSIVASLTGWIMPGLLAGVIAFFPTVRATKFIANTIATIMPKTESSAMSKRFLGGHHGVISQGIAKRGKPAEAKIKDRHGNTHYLRVEPLDDKDEIPQGASVHVIRKRSGMFYVVNIS